MAERSSINQSVQIGVEATPGTAVAASKRLQSMGIEIGMEVDINGMRPIGQKYPSLQILGKEWASADISGTPCYTELPYAWASVLSAPTVTQVMDGATATGAYRWLFSSNSFGDDAPKTFTVEQGSAFRAHRITNAILSDYSWDWSRDQIELGGSMLGRAIEDGVTMTAAPTTLPLVPVLPAQLSVYLDPTYTALGTTKLLRVLKGEFNISDRFKPLWVVDAAQPSYANTIEDEPTVEMSMTQMADAAGMANLVSMRGGATRFMRLQAKGPVIYTPGTGSAITHSVTIDMAGQIGDVGDLGDEDGVYAAEWTWSAVHDGGWGKAFQVEVVTTTATL